MQARLRYLTAGHLLREASTWGVPDAVVTDVVSSVATRVRAALPVVGADGIDTDRVAVLVDRRAEAAIQAVSDRLDAPG